MPRKLRIYHPDGDFYVEVPEKFEVTFGYFNPGKADDAAGESWGRQRGKSREEARTCLRIYDKTDTPKVQVAVFLGATGYRDTTLALTKLEEKMTVVQTYVNDPETGQTTDNRSATREVKAIPEKTAYE